MGIRTLIQFGLKLEVFYLDLAALAGHVWHALKLQGISCLLYTSDAADE